MAGKTSHKFRKRSFRTISKIPTVRRITRKKHLRFKKKMVPPKMTPETMIRKGLMFLFGKPPPKTRPRAITDTREAIPIKPELLKALPQKMVAELKEKMEKGTLPDRPHVWMPRSQRIGRHGPWDWELGLSDKGVLYLIREIRDVFGTSQYANAIRTIALALRLMRVKIETYANRLIDRWVPKDVGTLRESLRWGLTSYGAIQPTAYPYDPHLLQLKMACSTPLPYFQYVNQRKVHPRTGRPISLAHFGSPISKRTGKALYDPHAIKGFHGLLKLRLKIYGTNCVKDVYRQCMGALNLTYNGTKSMFNRKGFLVGV